MSDTFDKYVVVRFANGSYEWLLAHVWEAHKRVIPNTTGEAVSEPIPIQDAINFAQLATDATRT